MNNLPLLPWPALPLPLTPSCRDVVDIPGASQHPDALVTRHQSHLPDGFRVRIHLENHERLLDLLERLELVPNDTILPRGEAGGPKVVAAPVMAAPGSALHAAQKGSSFSIIICGEANNVWHAP